jgi:hypothetical protein
MDNDQITYITHRLQRYEESIRKTGEHFGELESFGNYRACAPYYEKFGISLLIDGMKSDDNACDSFLREYARITEKLTALETIKGSTYRDLLYEDLKNYVAAYHTALCYADLKMIAIESDHDLFNREAIRALLAELQNDYDTDDMEKLVTTLDELFLHMRRSGDEICQNTSQVPERAGYTPVACSKRIIISGEQDRTRQV